jgi:hypothetical protein
MPLKEVSIRAESVDARTNEWGAPKKTTIRAEATDRDHGWTAPQRTANRAD